jgi:hypothetical protein
MNAQNNKEAGFDPCGCPEFHHSITCVSRDKQGSMPQCGIDNRGARAEFHRRVPSAKGCGKTGGHDKALRSDTEIPTEQVALVEALLRLILKLNKPGSSLCADYDRVQIALSYAALENYMERGTIKMSKGNKVSTWEQRLLWLSNHGKLREYESMQIYRTEKITWLECTAKEMKAAGLYASTTYVTDCVGGLRNMLDAILCAKEDL